MSSCYRCTYVHSLYLLILLSLYNRDTTITAMDWRDRTKQEDNASRFEILRCALRYERKKVNVTMISIAPSSRYLTYFMYSS
jgi:hypothetical protein